jgi:uncharacterized protein (TIGR02996 family)
MGPREPFLRAIIEAPDDDTPRLIYADWLDEHGDEARAEFIRVQCSLEGMPADDRRRPKLQRREKELLAQYGWAWAEELGDEVSEWAFRRGFVERVEMRLEMPCEKILGVLQKAPIRHIRDTSQFCDLSSVVAALPHLQRLTGLEFWGLYAIDDALLAKILKSPHLANLCTLILHHDRNGNLVEEKVLVEAMQSPHRSNLEELAVNVDSMWRGPSRTILAAIAGSPYLRKLRRLNLTNAGDEGHRPQMDLKTARALGRSPNLAGLEELDMGRTSFSLATWDEVLRWPFLPRLKWLRLYYARQVRPPGRGTIAQLRDLPDYRQAFEQKVANVDWDTQWVTPHDGTTCWHGLSWHSLGQQHLFSVWPYVQRRDYDGLEAAFRADCCKYAGDEAADAIDALLFNHYQKMLGDRLKQAIDGARQEGVTSIYLRIRPDLNWNGEYHLSTEPVPEPFTPHACYSYRGALRESKAPSFPEAGQLRDKYPKRNLLDPGGAYHYLLARTVAAFGRAIGRSKSPVPIFFDCVDAVFRMHPGGS